MASIVLGCLVLSAGCASDASELPTTESRRATLTITLRESGDIEAVRSSGVKVPRDFREDMTLVELLPEGTPVDSGQVVARLDAPSFVDELRAARVALGDARAELVGIRARAAASARTLDNAVRKAELALDLAKLELDNRGFEAETVREEARLQVAEAALSVTEAESKRFSGLVTDSLEVREKELEIATSERELVELEADYRALTLRAPTGGIVVYEEIQNLDDVREPRVGDTVFPGTTLITIPDLSRMQVSFGVAEVDRPSVALGAPVRLTLEADREAAFSGTIAGVSGLALPTLVDDRVRAFRVTAEIEGTDPRLRPGMTAVVEVILGERPDVVVVPRAAVFESGGVPVVFPKATWPQPRRIEIGRGTDMELEVVDGLEPGVELVVVPSVRPDTRGRGDGARIADVRPLGHDRFWAGSAS